MKKVVMIYSINVNDGVAPSGYANVVAPYSFGAATIYPNKKFQEKLQAELSPEVEIQFISYDMNSNEIPAADLIVYHDVDAKYLSDEIKKIGLGVSFQDVTTRNFTKIKEDITHFLATASN